MQLFSSKTGIISLFWIKKINKLYFHIVLMWKGLKPWSSSALRIMIVGTIIVISSPGESLERSFMTLSSKRMGTNHKSLSLKLLLHTSWPGSAPRAHQELQDSMSQRTLLGPLHQGWWDNISRTAKSCILTRVNTDLSVTMRVQKGRAVPVIGYVSCPCH